MSPPSWRLVAPVNYPGSANKVDGLAGRVGRQVGTITRITTKAPHAFPNCRIRCANGNPCWLCACAGDCSKNKAVNGGNVNYLKVGGLCLTAGCSP